MILKIKLLIFAVLYIIFRIQVYRDALEYYIFQGVIAEGNPLHVLDFIVASFTMQQLMFIHTFFFIIYLFITYKPITTPQFILRCRPSYFRKLLLMGFEKAGIYSLFVIFINTIIPILYGSPIEFNIWYFLNMLRFFLTVFVMFLIYLTLIFVIKQEIFSIIGIGIINFILSAATLFTWNVGLQIIVMNGYLLLGGILMGFLYLKCKKGEFL